MHCSNGRGPSRYHCRQRHQPVCRHLLSPLSAATARQNTAAFRSGLRELGYLDGRNATVEVRYADGAVDRMALLASELVALKPALAVVSWPWQASRRSWP